MRYTSGLHRKCYQPFFCTILSKSSIWEMEQSRLFSSCIGKNVLHMNEPNHKRPTRSYNTYPDTISSGE